MYWYLIKWWCTILWTYCHMQFVFTERVWLAPRGQSIFSNYIYINQMEWLAIWGVKGPGQDILEEYFLCFQNLRSWIPKKNKFIWSRVSLLILASMGWTLQSLAEEQGDPYNFSPSSLLVWSFCFILFYFLSTLILRFIFLREGIVSLKPWENLLQLKKEFHFCGYGQSVNNRVVCVYNWYSLCIMIYLKSQGTGNAGQWQD